MYGNCMIIDKKLCAFSQLKSLIGSNNIILSWYEGGGNWKSKMDISNSNLNESFSQNLLYSYSLAFAGSYLKKINLPLTLKSLYPLLI